MAVRPQTADEFKRTLRRLAEADGSLAAALDRFGEPQFWHRRPGFDTLVLFILEQQVSLASGAAAFNRLRARVGNVTPAAVLIPSDEELRADGFSRQKSRYVRELAKAVLDGRIDLASLESKPDQEVRRELVALVGIGPWTADVYLLSCLRRPDVWPVLDRALQVAAGEVLGLEAAPTPAMLAELGERWRPHRSSAARLMWHAYLSRRGRKESAFET
ncbi:MAG TPA: DNA-3-methyladenine glycosylase 2 family protein [Acidimicrobiia bacterium]|nr:DNA-3-methyladenine glycosylase 2 family protein [Acidimicrobiia bacterium]